VFTKRGKWEQCCTDLPPTALKLITTPVQTTLYVLAVPKFIFNSPKELAMIPDQVGWLPTTSAMEVLV
jgi:hypothetical protein